jgi:hypothetical protein
MAYCLYQIKDGRFKGEWLTVYPDDASRLAVGYGGCLMSLQHRMQYKYWKGASTNMASHLNYLQMAASSMLIPVRLKQPQ